MEGEVDDLYAVLVARDPRLLDVAAAAAALAPLEPGLSALDLRARLRYAGGLIELHAHAGHAEEVVRALAAIGVESVRVPTSELPPLPPAQRVWRLATTAEGWQLWLGPTTGDAPRPPVELAVSALDHVHGFALETLASVGADAPLHPDAASAQRAGEAGPLGEVAALLSGQLARRARRGQAVRLGVDLLTDGARYRIERGVLWPSSGTQHSLEAFAALLLDLRTRAGAALSAETGSLCAGILEPSVFSHAQELNRFERWLLARARATPDVEGLLYSASTARRGRRGDRQ